MRRNRSIKRRRKNTRMSRGIRRWRRRIGRRMPLQYEKVRRRKAYKRPGKLSTEKKIIN